MDAIAAVCVWVAYLAAWAGLRISDEARRGGRPPRPTAWGVGLWCAVAIPSLLQFAIPAMLEFGRRDPAAILDGERWRVGTSMFLQDGGWAGTAFNLVTLAITVALVRDVVTGPATVVLFLVGGVVSNVLTLLVWPQPGAGNSMATMFLVVTAVVVAHPWHVRRPAGIAVIAVLAAVAAVLLLLQDPHGLAVASGLLTGLVLAFVNGRLARHRPSTTPDNPGA